MKLKVPKKERRKSGDSRGKHILRNVMIVLCVLALMGLAGTHLLKLITGNEMLAIPENGVAAVVTPLQSGFASVVNWISDYFYTLKLRSRLELEYNNLRQENEQLTYQAMLAEELQHKLSVYENLFDEVSDNEQLNPLVATVIGRESGNYFSVSLTFYYKFIIFHRCLTSITFAVFGNIIDRKCQLPVTDRLVRMVRHSKIILAPILIYLTFRKRYLHFSVIRGKTFTVFRYYFFRRPWTKSCHQSKHQNTRPYFSYFLFHFPSPFPYLRSSYSFLVKR